MSLKELFLQENNLLSTEPLTKDDFKDEVESFDYADAIRKRDARFLAIENFDDPSTFARYGSAEKYYHDSISHIYNSYPYDGSLKEKVLWELSSSLLDIYLFDNGYPRTTGYANFLTSVATSGEEGTDYYPPSGDDEYILVKGGPHPGTGGTLYYNRIEDEVVYRKDANIFDLDENRENNLLIDGTKGNTIEFWLKKDAYVADQEYFEVIYDAHVTGTVRTDDAYGRFTLSLATTGTVGQSSGTEKAFHYTYQSGTTKINNYIGALTLTTASVADGDWHHYAFRIKTTGSNTVADLFVDGEHSDRQTTPAMATSYVSGAIVASIGAQVFSIDDGLSDYGARGWSKFSGSIDELRYWKTWRTSKKIQRYWFDQVGGGTNTDLSNTNLGAYFKFNEGITGDTSIDSTALDYSGRVSNGSWTGYSSNSRNIGSAIDSADILMTSFSASEFRDPIIYSSHPDVSTYLTNMKASGSVYDDTNTNSMTSYIPEWIMEENYTESGIKDKNYLTNLLQVISSYFDEASLLIEKLPNLAEQKYYSGIANPPPFNKKGLDSVGFVVPELFISADLLETFEDRDDQLKFEKTLQEVKSTIYQNIYNNLNYIYKSKGTVKSFRNLFHCFGLGDDVLKFNLYGNNNTYKLEDNLKFTTKNKNYINFNETANSDASVYQYQIDSTSTSFISGTAVTDGTFENAGLSFTLESNVIMPNRTRIADYHTIKEGYEGKGENTYPLITSSSLFGVHSAVGIENDLTWATNDYANFQVITIKDDTFSSNARFKLTGTAGSAIPELVSSLIEDIYDDQLWTVSVTVEPESYPQSSQVGGTISQDYTVRFYGVNYIADYKAQEFLVTGTMTNAEGRQFMSSHKRVFVGAHRNNFTGSVVNNTDVKINSCKAWMNSIPTDTIDNHNLKLGNYGAKSSTQNAYLYQDSVNDLNIPEIKTLALMWDFTTVTGSDASGEFSVMDESSGSATDNRYGWFSDVVSRRHTASGSFFAASSTNVVQSLDRGTYQSQLPEILLDSNLTRILSQDDEYFNRNTRPITYHMSIEKNMFQDISEEMLNMFGSVVWFNNMIGNPVNVYRGEYKELKNAADLFFEKVDNNYDFDKYVEYFKFIDTAMSYYILELIPASMNTFEDGISTMIENFVLGDRNKFAHKYPLIKDEKPKKIIGEILGINEQLYNWKFGHAPLSNDQDDSCLWWSERAKKTNTDNTSGDADVDADRQGIQNADINETNASAPTLYDSATDQTYEGSTYVTRRLARPYNIDASEAREYHGGANRNKGRRHDYYRNLYRTNLSVTPYGSINTYNATKSCNDDEALKTKTYRHYTWDVEPNIEESVGKIVSPFNIMSASADISGTAGVYGENSQLQVVDIHNDLYGADSGDRPLQGPFTDAHVGGQPQRHTPLNDGTNTISTRAELFRIDTTVDSDDLSIFSSDQDLGGSPDVDLPRADYYRNVGAKRPINIANIHYNTGSQILGNYSQGYEIVLTNGRSINNRFLAEGDGVLGATSTDSIYVSGVVDFALPRFDLTGSNNYIIVNRFSSPGDPSTMGEGMLDITAGEYSIYNALPWRNLNNRLSLDELYRDHAKQFGYFSDAFYSSSWDGAIRSGFQPAGSYPGSSGSVNEDRYYADSTYLDATASFHKVNRNGRLQPYLTEYDLDESFTNTKVLWNDGGSSALYVDIGTAAEWNELIGSSTVTQAYTFSAWVNATELNHAGGNNFPRIFDFGYGDIAFYTQTDGKINYYHDFTGTGGWWYTTNANQIIIEQWIHVAVTYDARSVDNDPKIYVNGTSVELTEHQTPVGENHGIESADCLIGDRDTGGIGDRTWKGFMDEISMWSDALSGDEIKEIYEGSRNYVYRGGPGNLNTHSAVSKLIAWWRVDDASGFTLPDSSGNGHNALMAHTSMDIDNDGAASGLQPAFDILEPVITYHEQTEKKYDNWFIQHQIPQTDVQYAWITASAWNVRFDSAHSDVYFNYTGSALYGFEQPDYSNASLASTDITFVSASNVGAWWYAAGNQYALGFSYLKALDFGALFIPIDFAHLNTSVYEPISGSSNTLGYPSGATGFIDNAISWTYQGGLPTLASVQPERWPTGYGSTAGVLNNLILNRQGPYGGANWKLYRKDNHPIVRYQKNNNVIGAAISSPVFIPADPDNPYSVATIKMSAPVVNNYTEPPITSKFKPLLYEINEISVENGNISSDFTKNLSSLGNLRVHFTDHTKETVANRVDLNVFLPTGQSITNLKQITYSPYVAYKKYIEEAQDPKQVQVIYTEGVYPKGLYTYLSGSRKRINFANLFWRNDRDNRLATSYLNSSKAVYISLASIWKLDAHEDYTTDADSIPYDNSTVAGQTGRNGSGELQSAYSLFHYEDPNDCYPATTYVRRVKLLHQDDNAIRTVIPAGLSNTYIDLSDLPDARYKITSPDPVRLSGAVGDTLWEVTTSLGARPFYDSYNDYAEEGFRNLKDGTVLPEFRISEKIDDYVEAGLKIDYISYDPTKFFGLEKTGNNLKLENGMLSLTGSSILDPISDTEEFLERYTFSDFYKYFTLVSNDYNNESLFPSKKKLTCEAILKFLPYNGFYPSERCLQLGSKFDESLSRFELLNRGDGDGLGNKRTAMQPFYAPGVLFNSIKSGIAVDYPIFLDADIFSATGSVAWGHSITGNFNYRVNIDDLIRPPALRIFDAEVDPDMALNSTASLGTFQSEYSLAVSNFLAETVNTFIEKKAHIVSAPYWPNESIVVPAGQSGVHSLDIILRNSENIYNDTLFQDAKSDMFNVYDSGFPTITSSLQINSASVTMYDRAITGYNIDPFLYGSSFGPPVECGIFSTYNFALGTSWYTASHPYKYGTSFDPFTPPYYNGYSKAQLSVELEAGEFYDMNQIVSNLTYSYDRLRTFFFPTITDDDTFATVVPSIGPDGAVWYGEPSQNAADTTSYLHSMQLSASLYLGDENPNEIRYQRKVKPSNIGGNVTQMVDEEVLCFGTRWECPVLDFSTASPTPMYAITGNIAKGMWHQYGEDPLARDQNSIYAPAPKGISLEVSKGQKPSDTNPYSGIAIDHDLTKLLKIDTKQRSFIGSINDKQTFSEAIVVIPFKYNNNTKKTTLYRSDSEMAKFITNNLFYDFKDRLDPHAPIKSFDEIAKKEELPINKDMYNLITLMRKYVMPPHLDWGHNPNIKPYTMFMIEYKIDLDKNDIKNIWQNVEPTFARKALKVRSETNAYSFQVGNDNLNTPFFNNDPFKDSETRWAVFKVKKRARANYNSIVGKVVVNGNEYIRRDLVGQTNEFLYSYNWPYDFFSLIELAKIESVNTFNPIYNIEDVDVVDVVSDDTLKIEIPGFT